MIPSRGIRPISASFTIPSRSNFTYSSISRRQLSTALSRNATSNRLLQARNHLLTDPSWRGNQLTVGATMGRLYSPRFASTSASGTLPQPNAAIGQPTEQLSDSTVQQLADLGIQDLSSIPQRIGYLKELGLDFGWGPTALMEWCFEHVQIYSGLPWWGTILATSILVRLLLLKPYLNSSDMAARQSAMKEVTEPIRQRMNECMKTSDTQGMMAARQKLMLINKQAGISIPKTLLGPLLNGVLGFGMFRLMRNMASLPVPGMETGGLLWITDLTIPDPYYIFPIASGVIFHFIAKTGGEAGINNTMTPLQRKIMVYYFPVLAPIFTCWLPSGLQLYFVFNSLLAFSQASLLRIGVVRDLIGIAPIIKIEPTVPQSDDTAPQNRFRVKLAETHHSMVYHPPTINTTANVTSDEPKSAIQKILGGAKSDLSDAMKGIKKTMAGVTSDASYAAEKKKVDSKRESFLKSAQAYEKRRKAEIEEEEKWRQR